MLLLLLLQLEVVFLIFIAVLIIYNDIVIHLWQRVCLLIVGYWSCSVIDDFRFGDIVAVSNWVERVVGLSGQLRLVGVELTDVGQLHYSCRYVYCSGGSSRYV